MKHGFICQGISTVKTLESGLLKTHILCLRSLYKSLHDQKVGVWCAVSTTRIIGPIFFDETVTSARYISNILKPFFVQLNEHEKQTGWFQQDGFNKMVQQHIQHTQVCIQLVKCLEIVLFPALGLWPARSPHLTPPDFYLWGKLKGSVYAGK